MCRGGTAPRRLGLADRLWAFEGNGGQSGEQFIQFGIDDPGAIAHVDTLPIERFGHYQSDAR